ncbi:hypothetical protein [Sphingobacterium paludis]|uniref:Uncharacterized protein n=1 Tax=Sphingobacterium paludis TaxID=1476465 RepID=A0A4R7D517_9SPHI|nr:hypothetical protein [Sphingobacterium paludis]TDS13966.1 hypothetical protein B0I21_104294 [Sphingobacterium paludis]
MESNSIKGQFIKISKTVLFVGAILLTGCQKLGLDVSPREDLTIEPRADVQVMSFPTFDWESETYVPTPPGTARIHLPWHSTAERMFENSFNDDYASADGWTLLVNTFSETEMPQNPYFVLYNKYRGVVRLFVYASQSSAIPSEYMVFSLGYEGVPQSSMYAYHSAGVIDVSGVAPLDLSQIIPFKANQQPTWYGAEFEVAYDPTIINISGQLNRMRWQLSSRDFSTVTLGGSAAGTIDGIITQPETKENLFTRIVGAGVNAFLNVKTLGLSSVANIIANETVRENVVNATDKAGAGIVGNFLNGILGTKGTNESTVDLKINMDINMNGTITASPRQIAALSYAIPGANMMNVRPDVIPLYNKPLGVFYISGKPKVNIARQHYIKMINGMAVADDQYTNYLITLDQNSYDLLPNTSLSADAEITVANTELLILNPAAIQLNAGANSVVDEGVGSGNVRKISNNANLRFNPFNNSTTASYGRDLIGVRMTIEVRPRSGSRPTKIVKTFLCDIVDRGQQTFYVDDDASPEPW